MNKLQNKGQSGDGDGKDGDKDDQPLLLSRTRCLSVIRGLVALLLSMDFTCHVDLFLVACKVRYIFITQIFTTFTSNFLDILFSAYFLNKNLHLEMNY